MQNVLQEVEKVDKQNTTDRLAPKVETVKQDLKELGRAAGAEAKIKLTDARDRGEHLLDRTRAEGRALVARRPLVSLAVAAGLGAFAGLLLGRR